MKIKVRDGCYLKVVDNEIPRIKDYNEVSCLQVYCNNKLPCDECVFADNMYRSLDDLEIEE